MSYAEHFKSKPLIAGVDEAGRGPLAGPVTAAAVILPENHKISGLKDSKKLADIYLQQGFEEVTASAGMHPGTFKVFVNYIPLDRRL